MKKQYLEKRLAELKAEFASGQKAMAELQERQAHLRETLLRISGAIQVLEEAIGEINEEAENSVDVEVK